MIIERRQNVRPPIACLVTVPKTQPVCTIIKGLAPPPKSDGSQRKGIFLAYSPLKARVAVGADYIDAFLKLNGHRQARSA